MSDIHSEMNRINMFNWQWKQKTLTNNEDKNQLSESDIRIILMIDLVVKALKKLF